MKWNGKTTSSYIRMPSELHHAVRGCLGAQGPAGKIRKGALERMVIGSCGVWAVMHYGRFELPADNADAARLLDMIEDAGRRFQLMGDRVFAYRLGRMKAEYEARFRRRKSQDTSEDV